MNSIKIQLDKTESLKDVYQPSFFRLTKDGDKDKFEALTKDTAVFIHDEIEGQLRELIKSLNPTLKIKKEDYPAMIQKHLDGRDIFEYGAWVYFPWSSRLVHILDEEEYIYLRTAANRHKITTAEQKILATKKVGVIGLSVGQSVSVTMAMERCFGELRLADFDTLELNNLNRIRTGVQNLGVRKVVAVAREIAEIDPYIKTVLYTDGLTEENIHDFYTKGGKLDIVIDECDGVDVKILCRIKARELDIPVLMEASDRGTLDVERFDLEPDRPIMHGWLQHLTIDFEVLKKLKTTEEKLPYILPISGIETLSPRMKASMLEIEQSITTWPQLASAVTLGGAVTADTCRRIFLGQFTRSGRYFIDLEQLVSEEKEEKENIENAPPELDMQEINDTVAAILKKLQPSDISLKKEDIETLLKAAIAAPSAGNNQPWRWHYQSACLFLFHERHRSKSFGDFKDIASYVALGASIENLALAAKKKNFNLIINYFPIDGNSKLIATIQFSSNAGNETLYRPDELISFISTRCTNRNIGKRVSIESGVILQLQKAVASIPGAELIIKDNDNDLNELAEILAAADRLRLLQEEGHYDFFQKEIRWSEQESRSTATGLDISTFDITPSEIVGLQLFKDPNVRKLIAGWQGGKGLERLTYKSVAASSAIGLITMPKFSSINYILGGRAVERMWLTATKLHISIQPMLAAILHFERIKYGNGEGMERFIKESFTVLLKRFEAIYPHIEGKGEIFLFRLSISDKPKVMSYRMPVEKVFSFT